MFLKSVYCQLNDSLDWLTISYHLGDLIHITTTFLMQQSKAWEALIMSLANIVQLFTLFEFMVIGCELAQDMKV